MNDHTLIQHRFDGISDCLRNLHVESREVLLIVGVDFAVSSVRLSGFIIYNCAAQNRERQGRLTDTKA